MAEAAQGNEEKLAWWRQARFGLFIHWGLYALPAGVWKDQTVPGVSEWIMKRAAIPAREYEQLGASFNPVRFDAGEWVNLAKTAGMKYIVITAKHHDGFAMFHSACSDYNIVDATPFGRDPMKELAEACAREGIRLCFYYSHYQDWHHPDAGGNDWDYPEAEFKDFSRYMRAKGLPQVRELLTQYGPVGLIWFDTPGAITKEQSLEFAAAVRELQPDCLINSRLGHRIYDYRSTGDNMIPSEVWEEDWEVPATMNHSWGYKSTDDEWKDAKELIGQLLDVNRKGGNYLLNIGPRADGTLPEQGVRILQEIGRWMSANGEAVYGTVPCPPFPYVFPWGHITHKPGKLFLHFFQWRPGNKPLFGLRNRVRAAYLLRDPGQVITVIQHPADVAHHLHRLQLLLPEVTPDPVATVVVLEYEGELSIDKVNPKRGEL